MEVGCVLAQSLLHFAGQPVELLLGLFGQIFQGLVFLLLLLVALEVPLGHGHHFRGELEHFHHLNTVALLHLPLLHPVLQHQLSLVDPASREHILDSLGVRGQLGHLVEVGGEQTLRADCAVQVLADSPGHSEPLASAGAPAQFVDQHQRIAGGRLEHAAALQHLAHESRNALDLEVGRTHPGYNSVDDGSAELGSRDVSPQVRQVCADADGPDVGRLAAHVRTSQDYRPVGRQVAVVGHAVLQTRVSHLNPHHSVPPDLGPGPLLVGSEDHAREGSEDVQLGQLN